MDSKTKEMIKGWIEMHRGDKEGVAVWMRNALKIGIKQARQSVAEAAKS